MSLTLPPLLPRLYAILDEGTLHARGISAAAFARELYDAGVRCMQYRAKDVTDLHLLDTARALRSDLPTDLVLVLNDRPDICLLAGCDGVHVGQPDISPAGARRIVGSTALIGLSTHSDAQVEEANATGVDYVAVGPVFATGTKADPDPVIGLAGLRRARVLTQKPLVAIGGITQANARSVLDAGADSIAVVSALLPATTGDSPQKLTEDFLALLL